MKIYGSAHIITPKNYTDSDVITLSPITCEGEVTPAQLKALKSSRLTWKFMDIPEEECDWSVDGERFETIKEFQSFLRNRA